MRISFPGINNVIYNYKRQTPAFCPLKPLEFDTVSFSGRKPLNTYDRILEVPVEEFPSEDLRNYMLKEAKKPENADKGVVDFHREYYAGLFACENLFDVKRMYPEFQDMTDIYDIYVMEINSGKKSLLAKIDDGEIEGLTIRNGSLEILKKYYGEVPSVIPGQNDIFGIPPTTFSRLADRMGIRMSKEYRKLIRCDKAKTSMIEKWKEDDYRGRMEEIMQSEEWRALRRDIAIGLWNDEDFRARSMETRGTEEYKQLHAELMRQAWQDEETRSNILAGLRSEETKAKMSENMLRLWQNEEHKAKMEEIHQSEEYRKKMSDTQTKNWQNEEFRRKHTRKEDHERRSGTAKKIWERPEYREKMSEIRNSDEYKEKHGWKIKKEKD